MDLAEEFCKYIISYILDNYINELEFLDQCIQKAERNLPKEQRSKTDLISKLLPIVDNEFERITYTDAVNILTKSKPYKKGRFEYDV